MNRKRKNIILVLSGVTMMIALLLPISIKNSIQPATPVTNVCPASGYTQSNSVVPPPTQSTAPMGEKTANVKPNGTPPTEINSEPPKPNATTEVLVSNEPPRNNTTTEPLVSETTERQTDTTPKMGDTRIMDGQKQVYVLGFGWIVDNDEPNIGIVADGDGDINKIVGTMD